MLTELLSSNHITAYLRQSKTNPKHQLESVDIMIIIYLSISVALQSISMNFVIIQTWLIARD